MTILKSLVHANIAKLHEIIDDHDTEFIYLVLDFLPGGSLAEKLSKSEGGLDEESARMLFSQLISVLHYCHEVKNLAHRDIKPANLMLDN